MLIEMKKRGENLARHYHQAFEYWTRLVPERNGALAFLSPINELPVFAHDHVKVTREAAEFSLRFHFPTRNGITAIASPHDDCVGRDGCWIPVRHLRRA